MSKAGKMCKCGHPATWHHQRVGACEYFKPCKCVRFTLASIEVDAETFDKLKNANVAERASIVLSLFDDDATGAK